MPKPKGDNQSGEPGETPSDSDLNPLVGADEGLGLLEELDGPPAPDQEPARSGEPPGDGETKITPEDLNQIREGLETLNGRVQNQETQFMQVLGELARRIPKAQPAQPQENPFAPGPPAKKEASLDDPKIWDLASKHPQILPQLLSQVVGKEIKQHLGGFRTELMGDLNRKDVGSRLRASILENYGEELQDNASPIMQQTNTIREQLAPILDPAVRNTDLHDQIAFLMAAAQNPNQVAKRAVSRAKAVRESRKQAVDMLSSLAGGGGRSTKDTEPTITETDEELAEIYGIDLKDEATRSRILANKGTENFGSLEAIRDGSVEVQ
jgi:hypothetical protein